MKSVGEVMAIGRTFQESFQKALRGLEVGVDGLDEKTTSRDEVIREIGEAGPDRIWYVGDAFRIGMTSSRKLSKRLRRFPAGSCRYGTHRDDQIRSGPASPISRMTRRLVVFSSRPSTPTSDAQRLLERFLEGAANRHHFAD